MSANRVIGVDNFCDFYDRSWKEMNLKSIKEPIEVEEIDITDGVAIDRLVQLTRPKAILHLAAMAGVRPSIEPLMKTELVRDRPALLREATRANVRVAADHRPTRAELDQAPRVADGERFHRIVRLE